MFPWLTVEQSIAFGLLRRPATERDQRVTHCIQMAGLTGVEKSCPCACRRRPRVLHGQTIRRPRLRHPPQDVAGSRGIWQLDHKTVLFVTRDVEEALQLADRVPVMSRRPAIIQQEVVINLPRPRVLDAPAIMISPGRGEKMRMNPLFFTSAAKLETQNGMRKGRNSCQRLSFTRVVPEPAVLR